MPYIIGITGGVGSGKSAVADGFRDLGVEVIDADGVAREVAAPGTAALEEIVRHFGAEARGADGALDRAWLRRRVFSDDAQRRWLEALLHPLIGERLRQRLNEAGGDYAMLESALLTRPEQRSLVQRLLWVDAPEALRLARVQQRDGDDAQARQIAAAQPAAEAYRDAADDIIDNSGDEASLRTRIEALHRRYRRLGR